MPSLYLSAAHKSSGKTTVSIGLCAALRARGLQVQPFKKGPDYIDPLWLSRASGRLCRNLDFNTQSSAAIVSDFVRYAEGADLAVIEGNKGLYDGVDTEGSDSNAALAKLLDQPVVLAVDSSGITRGLAPLLVGYQSFDPGVRIAGVILNKVAGPRHEGKLRAVVERYTDLPVLGALERRAALQLEERHLGLMPSNEDRAADDRIDAIGRTVAEQIDLDALLELAATSGVLRPPPPIPAGPAVSGERLRIGIARDAAFGFYYPGDLESLQRAGAELRPIDCLHDARLPEVDALFIGGGFPETQMQALAANGELRAQLRAAIDAGLPCYAECGGLMYLTRSIEWRGRRAEMVGVIPADTVMHARPQGRGHVRLRETSAAPWPRPAGAPPAELAAHEFHYSALQGLEHSKDIEFAYQVLRGTGIDDRRDGLVYRNLLASYSHLRDTDRFHWAERFVAFARACRDAQ